MKQVNLSLEKAGIKIKKGELSIIDASVIQASRHYPHKKEDGNTTQDKEATYTTKKDSKVLYENDLWI